MTKYAVCFTVAALNLWPHVLPATASPIISVLQEEAKPNTADVLQTGVRLAFREERDNWIPVCSDSNSRDWPRSCSFAADSQTNWRVALHGRELGKVETKAWLDSGYYSEIGFLKIVGNETLHTGSRTLEFAGWGGQPIYRPLLASNVPVTWRIRWRDSYPADVPMTPLFASMRKLIPTIPVCRNSGDRSGKTRPLVVADIHVSEIWKTSGGERLLGASLRPARVKPCEYDFDLVTDVWFYDDGKSGPRTLPELTTNEATHRVIDIGDLAGDGREEALFWLSGYDEDGFVLLYDGFRKSARFTWHYH